MRVQGRDFTFFALHFAKESEAREAYDTIRCLTCRVGSIERLYAFSYKPVGPEKAISGWTLYDPRREFKRMGISAKDTDKGWRISAINHDYQVNTPVAMSCGQTDHFSIPQLILRSSPYPRSFPT